MKKTDISAFTLERYRLGELPNGDREALEEILSVDATIRSRLLALDESDRELRLCYPLPPAVPVKRPLRRLSARALIAAALLICFLLPLVYFLRIHSTAELTGGLSLALDSSLERPKGFVPEGAELSIYLKGQEESPLRKEARLREGNTVQLAYIAPAGERYGVIFSIDGRSAVTMHYPYRKGQSSLLVSGKRTFLSEAYTLDDAPDYELFVMVLSGEPLNVEAVLWEAQRMAETLEFSSVDLGSTEEKNRIFGAREIFYGCEVETIRLLKE